MSIKNNYRYTITDRLGVLIVSPLGEAEFSIEWGREKEEKQYYTQELPNQIRFIGEAYQRFYKLEKSIYRCDYINITVDRLCGTSYIPWFSGRMTLNDGSWDIDNCNVTLELDDINEYSCLEDKKSEEVNLLANIYNRKTVKLYNPNIVIETVSHSFFGDNNLDQRCNDYAWPNDGSNYWDEGWVPTYHSVVKNEFGGTSECNIQTTYARQKLVQSCSNPHPGSDWILLFDTCWQTNGGPRQQHFVRQASVYNCRYTYPQPGYDSYTMTCDVIGLGTAQAEIDNGILLSDVLTYFVSNFCPGLTVVSDFFQINPLNPSDVNYVTGAMSKVKHLMLFQKSDVKRPTATGNASIAKITWEKLVTALTTMFKVKYRIEGNTVRIEHVSRFTPGLGLDLTQLRYAKYVKGKKKYTYEKAEIPKREEFYFMESSYGDFAGVPIVYNSGCITKESRNNVKKHSVENITTDVQLCLSNPASDSKVVSDEGFVMVACYITGTTYYMVSEAPILGGNNLNNSLGWAQLHRDYHKYERPVRTGTMNNAPTTFITVVPSKKGERITIPLCCDDMFDPDKLIRTALGNGVVDKATYSFKNQTLELDLLYVADDDLQGNNPPVAKNKNVNTYINQPVEVEVIDPDSDPDGTITQVIIVYQPSHGTLTVLPNKKVQYYPALGYTGPDYFAYKLLDDWSEPSNNAIVNVTVNPANMPPVAGDPVFTTNMNTVLNRPAPGAFTGSSDDVGFTLDSYQATSAQGGTVLVNADGSFSYTPALDYFGPDSFNFTIKDGTGLTDTGTVTINVVNPNYPIARPNYYQTMRNASLSINAINGLIADDGGTGTNTATAESKTTTAGGTVNIAADGSFSYVPLSGFTGTDTFKYTVSNGSGSVQGDATITVLPVIFAKLIQTPGNYDAIYEACGGGGVQYLGEQQTGALVIRFYSDSAGTIPFDVTGLDLVVNMKINQSNIGTPSFSYNTSFIANGSVFVADDAFITYRQYYGCPGSGYSENYYRDAVLISGLYTII